MLRGQLTNTMKHLQTTDDLYCVSYAINRDYRMNWAKDLAVEMLGPQFNS